jgi:hypothetical protein
MEFEMKMKKIFASALFHGVSALHSKSSNKILALA